MSDVLFVCVHNAGRSQMARAVFDQMAETRGLRLRAESAGTAPSGHVHANVVEAMAEVGLDLAGEKPRLLTNEMVAQAQRVVTMGCGIDSAACPAVFLKDVEDWGLPDPAGQPVAAVGEIRDSIRGRVDELLGSLGG